MNGLAASRGRFSTRYRSAAMLALLVPAVVLSLRPIDDVDIFWQVKLGQLLLEQGPDMTEPLCYRLAGQEMNRLGWLGQVGLAEVHRWGGWEAIQALHIGLYVTAFGMVWLRMRRGRIGPGVCVMALLLTFLPCMSNCSERPQTFAFAAFSVLVLAVEGQWKAWTYWGLVLPLFVVWQNVHPSLPVAAGVMAAMAVGRFADRRWGRLQTPGRCRRPLATAILAGAAVFATPDGAGIIELAARNAEISRGLGIGEWLPAHAMLPATVGFWAVLGLCVAAWLRTRLRLPWAQVLPIVLLTVASMYWTRMIVFWALLVGPTLARLLHRAVQVTFISEPFPGTPRWSQRLHRAGVMVLAGSLVLANPWVRPTVIWLPQSCRPLFDSQLPLAGVGALKGVLSKGRIYNYREWAGLIAFAGAPDWQVAIDGRIYLHAPAVWQGYADAALGGPTAQDVLLDDNIEALFLRPGHDAALIELATRDSRWFNAYRDANCSVFLRRLDAVASSQ
ncbi:MAG: hypothetical protein ACE5GE_05805 [Phycisphaerae bacterium]